MPIFRITNHKLKKLRAIQIDKEKELQKIVEGNINEVLDMHFLASEYTTTTGGRIDTLAVDYDGAPVIIEYKRKKNDNVINQALSYLKWLKLQKVEFFERLIEKKLGKEIAEKLNLDWNNKKVICIAESYNKFDIDTVEMLQEIRIELYKYRFYDGDIFSLEPVEFEKEKSQVDICLKVEQAENTVEGHLEKANSETEEIFKELQSRIFEIDEDIKKNVTKSYIAYRLTKRFIEIHIQKTKLLLYLRPIDYIDEKGLVTKVSETYRWTLDSRVYLESENDIDYVFGLIEQSYNDVL